MQEKNTTYIYTRCGKTLKKDIRRIVKEQKTFVSASEWSRKALEEAVKQYDKRK